MLCRSHIFTNMSGSVAGITYSRNRYAAIVGRGRSTPVNVNTNYLEEHRTRMNLAIALWKSLTDAQRQSWKDFADGTPWKNKLGDDVILTGQAMYVGQLMAALAADPATVASTYNTAPCVPGMFPAPTLAFSCCTTPDLGVVVNATNNDPTNAANIWIQISPAHSPSKTFYTGPYRPGSAVLLTAIAAGDNDDASFCALCAGRYFFRARAFDDTNNNNMSTPTHGYFDACTTV